MGDWEVQEWDDGQHYEDGDRWQTTPQWVTCHEHETSLQCLAELLDLANRRYFEAEKYRVLCKITGAAENVDMDLLRYQKGSHLDLQRRLTAMFKGLVLSGVHADEAARITDAELARAYG